MLEVDELSFAFKRKPILNHVSFTLPAGQIIGLVAPNGTGKTTLLRLLCGLLPPSQGTISLDGLALKTQRTAYLRKLFFLESSANLYADLTVRDHLLYVQRTWHSAVDLEATVARLGMQEYARKRIKQLSLGMKQHALLAMYLMADTDVLLIDEPLNGLDPTSIQQFEAVFKELRAAGKTLLVSSHQMDSVGRVCDEVFFLKHQQVEAVANTGQDMMALYTEKFLTEAADA